MISHTHPWTGAADGGKTGSAYRAAPCRASWASVGGRSGIVFIHLREQGRPQGASFSAGDLSRCCRRPKLSRYRHLPIVQVRGARRQRYQEDGGDERAAQYSRRILGRARELVDAVRLLATAAFRQRG